MMSFIKPLVFQTSKPGSRHRVRVVLPERPSAVTQRILTVRSHLAAGHHVARRPGDLSRATAAA